jgi:hypothetical protein
MRMDVCSLIEYAAEPRERMHMTKIGAFVDGMLTVR